MTGLASLALGQPAWAQSYGPAGTPVEVYRGRMENWTPVWVELADLGNGTYVLTALDGLDVTDNPPLTYVMRSNGRRGSSCALTASDGLPLSIAGCPSGKPASLRANLRGIKGTVQFVPVGLAGAMGYAGQAASGGSAATNSCALATLGRADLFPAGGVAGALASTRQALAQLPLRRQTSADLAGLRRERLQAIGRLQPSAWEIERLNYFDFRINRMFDFRYRAQVMQEKQQFQAQMANQPARIQASNRIAQIDAALAAAYDPQQARQLAASLAAFRDSGVLTRLDQAIAAELDGAGPLPVQRVLQIERGLAELDGCAAAHAPAQQPVLARAALGRQFERLAATFEQAFTAEIDSGLRSSALQGRLAEYESSPGLTAALAAAGRSGIWAASEARIAAIANREANARTAEAQAEARARERAAQAAVAAEAARLAVSRSGANPPTDGDILNAYVGYLARISQSTTGAVRLQQVPGSRFELSTRGAMGGQLWRVRFDVTGKSCTRPAAGTYDCNFTIRNSFSNARDGSFEAGMMAFSDGLMGLIFGRDAEGLTGRLQSNNVNRLLLTDQVPMRARFRFANGQFQSPQLFEKVWDNTLIRMPAGRR